MTATNGMIHCVRPRGGHVTISVYHAGSDAASAYLGVDANEVAVATSVKEVVMPHDVYMEDIVGGPATGAVEVLVDGQRTGCMADYAAHTPATVGRPQYHYPIWKGQRVSVRVIAACAT
jgi:hypothetical protein